MKKAKRILSGMLVAVMAAALLAGCGSADSGAAASGQHYNLAYQCAWGSGGGPYQYASDLSKAIVSPLTVIAHPPASLHADAAPTE